MAALNQNAIFFECESEQICLEGLFGHDSHRFIRQGAEFGRPAKLSGTEEITGKSNRGAIGVLINSA